MSFQRSPRFFSTFGGTPAQPLRDEKSRPVLGVGWRVLVTCAGGGSDVTLTDERGTGALATVADGVEVEILAWRPRRGGDTRYRVVSMSGGVEGWVAASCLKAPPSPARNVPSAPPTAETASTTRALRPKPPRARRSPAQSR